MKCSSIRLLSRKDYHKSLNSKKEDMTIFVTEETHSYCYPYSSRKLYNNDKDFTNLAITYISLPEGKFYNTGSSTEKWANKKPRLKSSKSITSYLNHIQNDENLTEYDVSLLLNELDNNNCNENDSDEEDTLTSNLQYEVHSDIQELLMRSQREQPFENEEQEKITRNKKRHKKSGRKIKSEENNKNKVKKKLKKTIKFSLSKAPSPETEQVIRVDVVSNVTVDGCSQSENSFKNDSEEQVSKKVVKQLNVLSSEVLGISEKPFHVDEDFIVKCKQLALTQRKR